MPATPLIIVGASARAAAASAIRAGLAPWCVDLFADRDLRAIAPVKRCPIEQYPLGLADLLHDAPDAPVLLTGAMENHPEAIDAIARRRPLLGASPGAIRAARDPRLLATLPEVPGLGRCAIRMGTETGGSGAGSVATLASPGTWLRKPLRGSAGRGVRLVASDRPGEHDEAEAGAAYHQQFVPGTSVGAVFVAGRRGVTFAGLSRQIIGDAALGARGFQYAGSIGPMPLAPAQRASLKRLGELLVARAGLAGLFGVDLILDAQGRLWPIEVNPRCPASVEVIESCGRPGLLSLLDMPERDAVSPAAPAAAIAALPAAAPGSAAPLAGKAILYARHDLHAPDLYALLPPEHLADVPDAGEWIPARRPICTLLARGEDEARCLDRLHALAADLYTRLPT